jgi:hypothetical protein
VGRRMLLINEKEVSFDFDVSCSFSVYETDCDAYKGELLVLCFVLGCLFYKVQTIL